MTKHVYGITAPMGSGKSTVLKLLEKRGYTVVNTDELAKEVLYEIIDKVKKSFPECVEYVTINPHLVPVETFNIDKYADVIFTDPGKRKIMENLIYPILFDTLRKIIENTNGIIFIESAILFETGMDKRFNFESIIYIWTDYEQRKRKVLETCNITEDEFLIRENLQLPATQKMGLSDIFLHNKYDIVALDNEIECVLKQFII